MFEGVELAASSKGCGSANDRGDALPAKKPKDNQKGTAAEPNGEESWNKVDEIQ